MQGYFKPTTFSCDCCSYKTSATNYDNVLFTLCQYIKKKAIKVKSFTIYLNYTVVSNLEYIS